MAQEKGLTNLPQHQLQISEVINSQVMSVLSSKTQDFTHALVMANAIQVMKDALTPEIMQPIMSLAGSKLGFRTDKDKPSKGQMPQPYNLEIVKDCLIDAMLIGITPVGNQFNIIAGNMYVTKEGFTYLLKKVNGLKYSIIYPSVTFSNDKQTALVLCTIKYKVGEEKEITQTLEFTVKAGNYATTDSCIGKAERKAKCWLYNHVSGTDLTDGDAQDIDYEEVNPTKATKQQQANEKERNRFISHIEQSEKLSQLFQVKQHIENCDDLELQELYVNKENELIPQAIKGIENLKDLEKLSPHIIELEHIILLDDKKRELSGKA